MARLGVIVFFFLKMYCTQLNAFILGRLNTQRRPTQRVNENGEKI